MFNSYNQNIGFNYSINAVSGTLRKSHPKSKICVRIVDKHQYIFDEDKPRLTDYSKEVVVLQVMLTGENKVLVEYVLKTDFESDGG